MRYRPYHIVFFLLLSLTFCLGESYAMGSAEKKYNVVFINSGPEWLQLNNKLYFFVTLRANGKVAWDNVRIRSHGNLPQGKTLTLPSIFKVRLSVAVKDSSDTLITEADYDLKMELGGSGESFTLHYPDGDRYGKGGDVKMKMRLVKHNADGSDYAFCVLKFPW